MAVNAYLVFNGNCREAVEFYAKVFNTEAPKIMTFGEAPQNPSYVLPEQAKKLVMHTDLNFAGGKLMFSDTFPGNPFTVGNNVSIAVVGSNVDDLKSYFNNIKEGGIVTMELQETFWSKCFGMVKDKFGIEWQFSHEEQK